MSYRIWLATLFAVASTHALADDPPRHWYILNFATGKCIDAKLAMPETPNPDAFHRGLRAEGLVDKVHVNKTEDGVLREVAITVMKDGQSVSLLWFPSVANCELAQATAKSRNLIPDEADLK